MTIGPILQWPVRAMWYLTSQCNIKCDYCLNSSSPNEYSGLSTNEALEIVDLIKMSGVSNIVLLGGEPLYYDAFFAIIKKLFHSNIMIQLVTNGLLLDDFALKELIYVRSKLASVQISLHVRDKIEWYTNLITKLVSADIKTTTLLVLTRENMSEVPDIYRKVASSGATSFAISNIGEFGRAANGNFKGNNPTTKDLAALVVKLKNIQKSEGYFTIPTFKHRGVVSAFLKNEMGLDIMSNICKAAISEFQILPDGCCLPCYFLDESEKFKYMTSSLLSLGSIDKAWNSKQFQNFRYDKIFSNNSPILDSCMTCTHHISGRCSPCVISPSGCQGELDRIKNQ